jgi:hypothetical protein
MTASPDCFCAQVLALFKIDERGENILRGTEETMIMMAIPMLTPGSA